MADKPELTCGNFGGQGQCPAWCRPTDGVDGTPGASLSPFATERIIGPIGGCLLAPADDVGNAYTATQPCALSEQRRRLILAFADAYRAATGQPARPVPGRPEAVTRVLGIVDGLTEAGGMIDTPHLAHRVTPLSYSEAEAYKAAVSDLRDAIEAEWPETKKGKEDMTKEPLADLITDLLGIEEAIDGLYRDRKEATRQIVAALGDQYHDDMTIWSAEHKAMLTLGDDEDGEYWCEFDYPDVVR